MHSNFAKKVPCFVCGVTQVPKVPFVKKQFYLLQRDKKVRRRIILSQENLRFILLRTSQGSNLYNQCIALLLFIESPCIAWSVLYRFYISHVTFRITRRLY